VHINGGWRDSGNLIAGGPSGNLIAVGSMDLESSFDTILEIVVGSYTAP